MNAAKHPRAGVCTRSGSTADRKPARPPNTTDRLGATPRPPREYSMQDWLHHAALAADPHAADAPRSQSWIEGDAHGYRDGVMFGWFGGAMVGALLAALLVLGGQARGWW